MFGYDKNKDTTAADVSREASEAGKEVKEAVDAVLHGGDVGKELKEAVDAVEKVAGAAVDAVADGVKRFFKTKLGYQLHDPVQNKTILPHEAVEADLSSWVQSQVDADLVIETDDKGAVLPTQPKTPVVSKADAPSA